MEVMTGMGWMKICQILGEEKVSHSAAEHIHNIF